MKFTVLTNLKLNNRWPQSLLGEEYDPFESKTIISSVIAMPFYFFSYLAVWTQVIISFERFCAGMYSKL